MKFTSSPGIVFFIIFCHFGNIWYQFKTRKNIVSGHQIKKNIHIALIRCIRIFRLWQFLKLTPNIIISIDISV